MKDIDFRKHAGFGLSYAAILIPNLVNSAFDIWSADMIIPAIHFTPRVKYILENRSDRRVK